MFKFAVKYQKAMKSIPTATLLLLMLLLVGCQNEHKYKIGVSQCSQDDWRMKLNDEIMREALLHDSIEVEIRSADDDNGKQKADLRYFVQNGFDIIIAAPNEVETITPLLDSIYLSGTPVILFDRRTNSDHYTSFLGADNKLLGCSAAQYIQTLNKAPRILELMGKLETSPAQERHKGFTEKINSMDNAVILASAVGDWTDEGGQRVTDSLLRLYPQANIIYAHNDRMAIGASKAAERLGRRKDISIIGIDASPQIGLKAVHDSVIDASFIYPTDGRRLIQSALSVLKGEKLDKDIALPVGVVANQTNAEIMQLQDEALKVETNNIKVLKQKLNVYWERYSMQTALLYGIVIILALSSISLFLLLRGWRAQRRHRTLAEQQNAKLEAQRDEIERQYVQLQQKNDEISQIMEQLRQATQSKLTFFTNVSHDLRTPLTLIAEPVSQMARADNLTEGQHKLMALAMKNVRILMRLINQILDFRKYENGKLELNLMEVDVAAQMRDWTESFKDIALRRHLKFQVKIPDGDYRMAIDTDKMERVLFNLISNAFKFTPAGGTVRVVLSREADNIRLTVSDNGKGIPEKNIKQVFERFFKVDKISPEGSGIGLALSKTFVELHGGSIEVQSTEGKGTVFTVSLPVRHVDNAALTESVTAEPSAAIATELADILPQVGEPSEQVDTILVIDDNPDICALVGTLLQGVYTVIYASNGLEGIKLAAKYVPDLIICDIMMPGIDGLETCRRLKQEVTTSHIPVLMLTACAMDEQRIAGYDCGADAYLIKPFNGDLLKARIKSLVANRKRLKELYLSGTSQSGLGQSAAKWHDMDHDFYAQFLSVVEEEISNSELCMDDIASRMGISRVQLYRKIKALTNYSPTDLVRNLRLQQASRMLKSSDMTIAEVCYAVGFTSHSYFTKCYREYFGELPSESQKRTSKIRS